jgi:DNA-directed RNA polymerase subunit RPC12/RpoP
MSESRELCPECGREAALVIYAERDREITVLVCRHCRMRRFIKGPSEEVQKSSFIWKPIRTEQCQACGRPRYNWPYFSEPHECPKATEAGRYSATYGEGHGYQPKEQERLRQGFELMNACEKEEP